MELEQIKPIPEPIPTPEVSNSKKPSLLLVYLLFIIIFLGIASWVGVYLGKNNVQSVNEVTVVSETDTWKTYRNEEYGFEFKYPAELSIVQEKRDSFFAGEQQEFSLSFQNEGPVFLMKINPFGFGYSEGCDKEGIKNIIVINNVSMEREDNCGEIAYRFDGLTDDFFFYNFYYDNKIFDQILSTFKFLDKTLLSGEDKDGNGVWDEVQKYINTKYSKSEKLREALYQYTIAQQNIILYTNKDTVLSLYKERHRALDCIRFLDLKNSSNISDDVLFESILNTNERAEAYLNADRYLPGGSFPNTSPGQLQGGCNFDPNKLPN